MLARMILANYTRVALVDTGVVPLAALRPYGDMVVAFYALPVEVLPGSLRYVRKLIEGSRDAEFLVVEPGGTLDEAQFWELESL